MRRSTSLLTAVTAVLVTIIAVWYLQGSVAPTQATWDDVLAEAASGGYRLITTDELAKRYLADPDGLLLIDTRQEWEHRSGHIERSLHFPMEPTRWARWRKSSELKELLGPDLDQVLVFY